MFSSISGLEYTRQNLVISLLRHDSQSVQEYFELEIYLGGIPRHAFMQTSLGLTVSSS